MRQIGLWHVTETEPRRLQPTKITLEEKLEGWIERDPTLLRYGLQIVGRQIWTDAGQLDLLALDPQGRWVLVELKRGKIRRETIGQALDYASCIAEMPFEMLEEKVNTYLSKHEPKATLASILDGLGAEAEFRDAPRDVTIMVVGTGRDRGLDRMVSYLADRLDVPLTVVSFQVFGLEDGRQILVRDIDAVETHRDTDRSKRRARSVEAILADADRAGVGETYRRLHEATVAHGVHARPYVNSIMYTPPQHHGRCLMYVPTRPSKEKKLRAYVATEAFGEFYSVDDTDAERILGQPGYHELDTSNVSDLIARLDQFFKVVAEENAAATDS